MRRRTFLTLAASSVVAGCAGGSGTQQPSVEEDKDEAQHIEYDKLMRNSEDNINEYVHFFDGQIEQVLGDENEGFQFRVYVTEEEFTWENDVLGRWDGERFLEDDIIEIWGRFNGLIT